MLLMLMCGAHASAEVLFERSLSVEERKQRERYEQYEVVENVPPADIARIRTDASAGKWSRDWRTLKIELLYRDGDQAKPYIKKTASGRDLVLEKDQAEWIAAATPRLTFGKDVGSLRFQDRHLHFVNSPARFYYDELGHVGYASERFVATAPTSAPAVGDHKRGDSNDERQVTARVYELLGHSLDDHEFLRSIVHGAYELRDTKWGPVFVESGREGNGPGERQGSVRLAWRSGEHLGVYIAAQGIEWTELLAIYGPRFPSSLPQGLSFDKTNLGRREVRLAVDRLEHALHAMQPQPTDWFAFHLSRLLDVAYIPAPLAELARRGDSIGRTEALKLVKVFAADPARLVWDDASSRLVEKGKSPGEVQAAATLQARQRDLAAARVPWQQEELSIAKGKLVDWFQAHYAERAEKQRKTLPDALKASVKFDRVSDEEWRIHAPRVGNVKGGSETATAKGPRVIVTNGDTPKLRGEFTLEWKFDEGGKVTQMSEKLRFDYDRASQTWLLVPEAAAVVSGEAKQ